LELEGFWEKYSVKMYGKELASQNKVKRRVFAGNQPSDSMKMGISWAAEQLLTIHF
jgi:hypothetical protein